MLKYNACVKSYFNKLFWVRQPRFLNLKIEMNESERKLFESGGIRVFASGTAIRKNVKKLSVQNVKIKQEL